MDTNNLPQTQQATEPRKDAIDFGAILRNYLRHWWWFVIALGICLGGAYLYLRKKSPVYLIQGMIMVNQQEDGGMGQSSAMSALMSSMGFGSTTGANPENEQMKMMSHIMLQKVVSKLELNTSYWQDRGMFERRINYYKNEPIRISIPEQVLDTLSTTTMFKMEGTASGPWELTVKQNKKEVLKTEVKQFPYSAKTPNGTFLIDSTDYFPKSGDLNVSAVFMSNAEAIEWLKDNCGVTYVSNKADALLVEMGDVIIERGKDIVNTIMELYNEGRDADRMAYNEEVLKFIDNRLLSLYHELETSESKIEEFKKEHKVVSAEAEAEYIFSRKGMFDENAVQLQTSIKIMEMIQQMLISPDTKYSLIPFSGGGATGLGEGYIKLIEPYNDLIIERMNLAAAAKSGNTTLAKLDEQLEAMRSNILSTVSRELQNARVNYKTVMDEQSKGNARMNEIPSMEHELITLYRDREVQNAIYAFLLQKREETQIALSQSQPVGKIIDPAYCGLEPAKPRPMLIYGAALLLGIGGPAVILQLLRRRRKK